MKHYIASATCDWGEIYRDEQVKASSFAVAFSRAGRIAQSRARRRPKMISIRLTYVTSDARLAARAQETAPEGGISS